ncbi:IS3 family transposase [Halomonas sp. N3-2A]|uniref:IS3 family transposase n=1 Tax=Halomonas sp. N3-2A TaxID=2014541 RepID=UPI00406D1DBC
MSLDVATTLGNSARGHHRQSSVSKPLSYHQRKGRSGAPRLALDLRDVGMPINRKTVAANLQRQGLRAKAARKFKATTNSRHSLPVAPNLLEQNFTASAPNQKWVSDITYLATSEGWLYLAGLIDLYSRKVVGWAMSERMTADLVCDSLQMELWKRKRPKGVIVHSDSKTTRRQVFLG